MIGIAKETCLLPPHLPLMTYEITREPVTKLFPAVLISLMVCASVVYFWNGEWKMGVYWASAALLNLSVTI